MGLQKSVVGMLLLVLFVGCSKSSDSPPTPVAETGIEAEIKNVSAYRSFEELEKEFIENIYGANPTEKQCKGSIAEISSASTYKKYLAKFNCYSLLNTRDQYSYTLSVPQVKMGTIGDLEKLIVEIRKRNVRADKLFATDAVKLTQTQFDLGISIRSLYSDKVQSLTKLVTVWKDAIAKRDIFSPNVACPLENTMSGEACYYIKLEDFLARPSDTKALAKAQSDLKDRFREAFVLLDYTDKPTTTATSGLQFVSDDLSIGRLGYANNVDRAFAQLIKEKVGMPKTVNLKGSSSSVLNYIVESQQGMVSAIDFLTRIKPKLDLAQFGSIEVDGGYGYSYDKRGVIVSYTSSKLMDFKPAYNDKLKLYVYVPRFSSELTIKSNVYAELDEAGKNREVDAVVTKIANRNLLNQKMETLGIGVFEMDYYSKLELRRNLISERYIDMLVPLLTKEYFDETSTHNLKGKLVLFVSSSASKKGCDEEIIYLPETTTTTYSRNLNTETIDKYLSECTALAQ